MTFLVFVLAFGKQFNLSNLDRHVSFTLPLLVVLKLEHAPETSEDMFGDMLLRPTSKVFDSVHLFAFPVDSQAILILLVWGSHLESHCIKCYNSSRLSHSSSLFCCCCFYFLIFLLMISCTFITSITSFIAMTHKFTHPNIQLESKISTYVHQSPPNSVYL